jgi:hypothetical protein
MASHRRNVLFGIASLPASTLLTGHRLVGLTATVHNGYELHTALQATGPGGSILLAPGNYGDLGGLLRVTQPEVTIRAEPGAVIHRTSLRVEAPGVLVDGLAFVGSPDIPDDSEPDEHPWLHMAAVIENRSFTSMLTVNAADTEIRRCDFSRYSGKAIDVRAGGVRAYIHDNNFHDCLSGAGSATMVGASMSDTNKNLAARLINNTCTNLAPGSTETLSFKSSGNLMQGNRLENSNNLVNRHGNGNRFVSNTVNRSQGIVIQDSNTRLEGNTVSNIRMGPGIQIMRGSMPYSGTTQGLHPQAAFTVLRGNNGPLVIGRGYSGYTYKAINTTVESHTGGISLVSGGHEGTRLPGSGA